MDYVHTELFKKADPEVKNELDLVSAFLLDCISDYLGNMPKHKHSLILYLAKLKDWNLEQIDEGKKLPICENFYSSIAEFQRALVLEEYDKVPILFQDIEEFITFNWQGGDK